LIAQELQAATWADGSPVLPALGSRGAAVLAQHCESSSDVEAWIESEIMNLSDPETANPAGLLVYLAREQGSRPGTSSSSERARRAKAEKNNRLRMDGPAHVQRFDKVFRGLATRQRLEEERRALPIDHEAMAANRLEAEKIEALITQGAAARRAAELDRLRPRVKAPPRPEQSASERRANRSKMSALLAHLQETTT
jgi:hypothetical protein